MASGLRFISTSGSGGGGGSGTVAPAVTAGGSLGTTKSIAMSTTQDQWLTGTLTADLTLTVTNLVAGRVKLLGAQDATGGHALTVSDGTNSQPVTIPSGASAPVEVDIFSDGTDLYVEVAGGGTPGSTGSQGAQGSQGATGSQGAQGSAGPIGLVQDEGVTLTARGKLNFVGSGVTASDNPGNGSTDVTISSGSLSQSGADALYAPQVPGLCRGADGLNAPAGSPAAGAITANNARSRRVICPSAGFVRDVSIFNGTVSGNFILAVYDVGAATSTVRTLLWASSSTAMVGGNAWQTVDPGASAIPVVAHQHLELVLIPDNATATFGKFTVAASANNLAYPANFGLVGGCLLKLAAGWAPGSFAAPASVSEATFAVTTSIHALIARVA